MKQAYLVINESNKRLVNADTVNYTDYGKIFQCPNCGATLTLREGYYRKNNWISPTFVHPEGDVSDCASRVSFHFNTSSTYIFDLIQKCQSSKKLERAFLKYFDYHKVRSIGSILGEYNDQLLIPLFIDEAVRYLKRKMEYNEKAGQVYSKPNLLIDCSLSILKARQSQLYFKNKTREFEQFLINDKQAIDYFSQLKEKQRQSNSIEKIINNHCQQLYHITTYISQGTHDAFKKDFLRRIIWGSSKLPVPFQNISTQKDMYDLKGNRRENDTNKIEIKRKPQLKFLNQFNPETLNKLCKEPKFLSQTFRKLYQVGELPENEFIRFILSETFDSIKYCNWQFLPYFYND